MLWGLITFTPTPFESAPTRSRIPVDFISATEFSKLTAGSTNAPKPETPKPLVEKVAEKKPVPRTTAQKITEKPEIVTASTSRAAADAGHEKARAESRSRSRKPEAKPEKAEKAEQKTDPIAEALKKEEKKKEAEQKQAEAKPTPLPPKKPGAAAAEIRRRQGRGPARQARSAASGR